SKHPRPMQRSRFILLAIVSVFALAFLALAYLQVEQGERAKVQLSYFPVPQEIDRPVILAANFAQPTATAAIPNYLEKSLAWLAEAQLSNGGWGAGLHSAQQIRDPQAVDVDPATTAFSAMALLRAGSTHRTGPYHESVDKALTYLLVAVETAPREHINITDQTGTQPQRKLGENIDVAMTTQFLSKLLPHVDDNALASRMASAIDFCVYRLEDTQYADGSWNTQGWAPVLNSAMCHSALEAAQSVGRPVSLPALRASEQYQAKNVNTGGGSSPIATDAAAGIPLYALASTQRATAAGAREVRTKLKDAKVSEDAAQEEVEAVLVDEGYTKTEAEEMANSYASNQSATRQLQDDEVWVGFGNNGGEEYLSYMNTSESLVAAEDASWTEWREKISTKFEKIQNNDGSWSGHHCITSPVFCTAAIVLTMTADRDPML
ncbi:MAG: hypothetical protein AAF840_11370, partial [Bacteroidota bacterium]